MSAVQGLLFDKDGTLFGFGDTWEAWAVAVLLRATGHDHDRAQRVGMAIGFDLSARRFDPSSVVIAGTPDEVAEALAPHFPEYSQGALIDILNEEAATAPQAEIVPLPGFLDGLRAAGLRLGVATNDAEAPARAHLDAAGALDHFDFIAGSDSGYGAKPAPGQLNAFCDSTGLAPASCLMIGDSTHDLLAGRAAGMGCVAVLTGMADHDTLAPHADVVLPDIGHLPAWLAR